MIRIESHRGNKYVFARIKISEKNTRQAIRHAWFSLGKDLKQTAEDEILNQPKTGRLYELGFPVKLHRASKAGESHAEISGKLRRSISWKVRNADHMDFGYGVVPGRDNAPKYAHFVEFGEPDRNVEERPTLFNAIKRVQKNATQHFARLIMEKV